MAEEKKKDRGKWFREMKSELNKYCRFCKKHTVHTETK